VTDAEDKDLALDKLEDLVQPDAEPTLSVFELEAILDRNQRASRWTASVELTVGNVIAPSVPNGHIYRVIEGGIAGATEPAWPTGSDDALVDGAVTLVEAGMGFESVFDLRGAVQDAWALKAAKAAESLTKDGENVIFEHCDSMARRYATPLIG
jgi:hypothetical protein